MNKKPFHGGEGVLKMEIISIIIVVLGVFGGSIAKALSAFTSYRVLGMDTDPEVLDEAVACGAIERRGYEEDLPEADVLWLCLYPQAAVDFARKYGVALTRESIVTAACGF